VKDGSPQETAATGLAPRAGRHAALLTILTALLIITMRGVILFSGQRYLRSDEAVVGLMAKHIVTRGERPLFLYGQPYGGGHAIVAYLAAPLFAVFGRSAILLTGITALFSVVNALLVWLILRRHFDVWIALGGVALYAASPPAVYQSFLVNGGTESFFFALLALLFFLRAYAEGRHLVRNTALAGLFCGLAYYAMDYTLLYAIAMLALLAATGPRGKWACVGIFLGAFVVGCLPLVVYNATHDFAHMRHMLTGPPGQAIGFARHFAGALWGALSGDLAAFFSGEIDDFKWRAVGMGSWAHSVVAVIAVVVLLYEERRSFLEAFRKRSLRGRQGAALPVATLPAIFIGLYLAIYCSARFSLPQYRTPRYFLPLCPFVSIAIALFLLWRRKGAARAVGVTVLMLLAARGVVTSMKFGLRPWHEEHRIATSGREIASLGRKLTGNDIRLALAPYEIQWRLMFETDERVLISSEGISPLRRYPRYDDEFFRRIEAGEPFALIFRKDLAFSPWAGGRNRPPAGMTFIRLDPAVLQGKRWDDGGEFIVFYPLTEPDLARLVRGEAGSSREPSLNAKGAAINRARGDFVRRPVISAPPFRRPRGLSS